jgi:hypothetical protein
MALQHGACLEVACNLLDPAVNGPGQVEARAAELAAEEGLVLGECYRIGKAPEAIVAETARQLGLQAA